MAWRNLSMAFWKMNHLELTCARICNMQSLTENLNKVPWFPHYSFYYSSFQFIIKLDAKQGNNLPVVCHSLFINVNSLEHDLGEVKQLSKISWKILFGSEVKVVVQLHLWLVFEPKDVTNFCCFLVAWEYCLWQEGICWKLSVLTYSIFKINIVLQLSCV